MACTVQCKIGVSVHKALFKALFPSKGKGIDDDDEIIFLFNLCSSLSMACAVQCVNQTFCSYLSSYKLH